MDGELGLEFPNPPLGRGQLFPLRGAQPWRETAIDLVLAAPDLDDLLADPKVPGDLTHLAPGIDQVHDAPAKLC